LNAIDVVQYSLYSLIPIPTTYVMVHRWVPTSGSGLRRQIKQEFTKTCTHIKELTRHCHICGIVVEKGRREVKKQLQIYNHILDIII
jgi:hypothetical protein